MDKTLGKICKNREKSQSRKKKKKTEKMERIERLKKTRVKLWGFGRPGETKNKS